MNDITEKQIIEIDEQYIGQRLDKTLSSIFPEYSRSFIQEALKKGEILVNGNLQAAKYLIKGGETLEMSVTPPEDESNWQPENIPLDIIFEDEDIIVINKPIGLVVHPAAGNWSGTLVNGLLYHCPALKDLPRAGIVHRLDKETSGLLVVAKNRQTHFNLVEQLQEHHVSRQYYALVYGEVIAGDTIEGNIGRSSKDRQKMALLNIGGKPAITHYRIAERFPDFTLLKVILETGRTHQIRVHLASINYGIVGDPLYGKGLRFPRNASDELKAALRAFDHQALHARKLSFTHPRTGKEVTFSAPLPADFEKFLNLLREIRDSEDSDYDDYYEDEELE